MTRVLTIAILATLSLCAAEPGRPPSNAAIKYWQAFGQLPELTAEQQRKLDSRGPFDADRLRILEAAGGSLISLHRGARMSTCDWALDYADGPYMALPHIERARTLARLACLRARWHFEQGRPEAAAADLADVLVLARHLGREPIFLCFLVRSAIEQSAIDIAAAHLPRMDADILGAFGALLRALPPAASLGGCVHEKRRHVVDWLTARMRACAKNPKEDWKTELLRVFGPEDAGRALANAADSAAGVVRLLEDVAHRYDDLEKLLARPRAEFAEKWPAFLKEARAANPAGSTLLPPMDKLLVFEATSYARLALLRAAVAVARGGEGRLKDFPDPYGTGPFTYHKLPGGFTLASALRVGGQPFTLTVGR